MSNASYSAQTNMNIPIILQLKLQLQTLHFHLPLPFMLKYFGIRFPVFRWGGVPCTSTVLNTLVGPQCGQVPHHVSVGATE